MFTNVTATLKFSTKYSQTRITRKLNVILSYQFDFVRPLFTQQILSWVRYGKFGRCWYKMKAIEIIKNKKCDQKWDSVFQEEGQIKENTF